MLNVGLVTRPAGEEGAKIIADSKLFSENITDSGRLYRLIHWTSLVKKNSIMPLIRHEVCIVVDKINIHNDYELACLP